MVACLMEPKPAVADGVDLELEAEYARALAIVLAMNRWIQAAEFALLSEGEQERVLADYDAQLRHLLELAALRRPQALRAREERLTGTELLGQIVELFAA